MSSGSTAESAPGSPDHEQSRQLRGSSLLLTGRVLAMGINFATQILIIRYLDKADYGAFAYALSIVALVQAAIQLGLDRSLTRYVPMYDEQRDEERLFGTIAFVVSVVTALGVTVVLAVIVFRSIVEGTLVQDPGAVAVLAVLIALAPIEALDNLLVSLLAAFDQTGAIFLRRYVVAPALRLVVVGLLIAGSGSVLFLAGGYVLGGVLGLVIFGTHLVRLLQRRRDAAATPPKWRVPVAELLTFAIPLLTTDLVFMTLNATDAIMLERFGTVEDVASLRAVMPTARLNQVVLASFGILYVPFIARLFVRDDHGEIGRRYWQTAAWVVVLSFPILATTLLFSRELTADLLGEAYANSAVILIILSIGYYTNALFGFNGMTLNVYRAVGFVVVVNLLAVAGNIGLNLALIPRWGPAGAAVATAMTFVVHNLLKQLGLVRRIGLGGFGRSTAVLYAVAVAGGAVAVAAGLAPGVHFLIRVGLLAATSAAVIVAGRNVLALDAVFPEVARLPYVRRLVKAD